jgi:hypothetical protein
MSDDDPLRSVVSVCYRGSQYLFEWPRPSRLKRMLDQHFHLLYESISVGQVCVNLKGCFTYPARVSVKEPLIAEGAKGASRQAAWLAACCVDLLVQYHGVCRFVLHDQGGGKG